MDISEGGMYISVMQSYEIDAVIDLTIPFKEENLTLKAQVRYCQPGIGMGVQFVDLTHDQEAKIKHIIENLMG